MFMGGPTYVVNLIVSVRWSELTPQPDASIDHDAIFPPALSNAQAHVPLRWAMALVRAISAAHRTDTQSVAPAANVCVDDIIDSDDHGCVASLRIRTSRHAADLLPIFFHGVAGWDKLVHYSIETRFGPRKGRRTTAQTNADARDSTPITGILKACGQPKNDVGVRAFLASVDRLEYVMALTLARKMRIIANGVLPLEMRKHELAQWNLLARAVGYKIANDWKPNTVMSLQGVSAGSYEALRRKFDTRVLAACNWPPRRPTAAAWNPQPRYDGIVFGPAIGERTTMCVPRGVVLADCMGWGSIW